MIGKTIAHYEITSLLGKGGMGEVYQAKDTKLGRDVAIKVLPEEFARDADRVARFQREAKLLASLNHPNIAAIYGLEKSEETNFLVMELVEGETLADQIKRGPIPVEEALKLALQIAEALEAAHEKGVIHRDLKPANIKVTPEGKVKVLDFGLAKAFAEDQAEENPQDSPTLSAAATRQGVILGTAAYMSPEQAKGKIVDKRVDIWAFGAVLFEMLAGKPAFDGDEISEILASVIKGDSNLSLLPKNIHPRVREVLARCLQKDLRRRYSSITEAQYEIEQALADPSGVFVRPITAVRHRKMLSLKLPWVLVVFILGLIIAGTAVWKLKPTEPRQVMRFEYDLPEGQQFSNIPNQDIDISRDGRQLVYSTPKGLYIRSMDELSAKLIPGTEGSTICPFFSPDAKWIGYQSSADMKLKKIAVAGGVPVDLCDAASLLVGAVWSSDDIITFSLYRKGIMQISANGGMPQPLKMGPLYTNPSLLPDGKTVMFTEFGTQPYKIKVQSLESGKEKELFAGALARYLPTGHIVYASGTYPNPYNLFAVPFNLDKLETTGGPVPLINNIFNYAISDSGTLVYIPGTNRALPQRTLVWVDRNGKEEAITAPPNFYDDFRISPDGTKVAVQVQAKDIWIWDLIRKTLSKLTFDAPFNDWPLWTPDGKRIVHLSRHDNVNGVYWKAADGTGKEDPLNTEGKFLFPESWSGDKKTIVACESSGRSNGRHFDIGTFSLEGDRKWQPLLKEKYNQLQPRLSPDGRWLAYVSDESGRYEVYVRPFPDVDKGRWQVSTSGGNSPLWSRDGKELFYRNGDAVMAVSVKIDPNLNLETPRTLFNGKYVSFDPQGVRWEVDTWDVSPDGKRFIMIKKISEAEGPSKINIVVNWFEELKQRMSVK